MNIIICTLVVSMFQNQTQSKVTSHNLPKEINEFWQRVFTVWPTSSQGLFFFFSNLKDNWVFEWTKDCGDLSSTDQWIFAYMCCCCHVKTGLYRGS